MNNKQENLKISDINIIEYMLKKAEIDYTKDSNLQDTFIEIYRGYIGFVTVITFDINGNLKNIEAYE